MATTNKKLGFGGQWIDGTPVGKHIDSEGDEVNIDLAFLEAVVANFEKTKNLHQPPAVIGHPKTTAPAYAYVVDLRVNNGRLERRFSETHPGFEDLVKSGAYKKRSDAFYLDPKLAPGGLVPALNHVGFLGATPPAIKGLADIQFSEDEGKHVDVDVDTSIAFSEGDTETMKDEEVKKTIRESIAEFFEPLTKMLKGEGDKPAAAFSEADRKKLIDDATAAATLKFAEELKKSNDEIEELKKQVASQSGSSSHDANLKFCESLAGTVLPWMKALGVVEFMDSLGNDVKEKKITVITFAEEGAGAERKQVEKPVDFAQRAWFQNFLTQLSKSPSVRFGEAFANVTPQGDGSDLVNPQRMKDMRAAAGLPDAAKKD